jgi:WD40 repeat protein
MPPSVQKISSQLFHVGCIFDLEVPRFPDLACWFSTFFTSGSDETIRVWNMNGKNNQEEGGIFSASNSFSNELRKVVYIGQNDDSLTEQPDSMHKH